MVRTVDSVLFFFLLAFGYSAISQEDRQFNNPSSSYLIGEVSAPDRYISLTQSIAKDTQDAYVLYFKNQGFPDDEDYCLITFSASHDEIDLLYLAFRERFYFQDQVSVNLDTARLDITYLPDSGRVRVVVYEKDQPFKWTDLEQEEVDLLFNVK